MIRYKYNDQEYPTFSILRQAIQENEHVAYGDFSTQKEFEEAGLKVEFVEVPDPVIPDSTYASRAREERDRLLQESDYLLMPDYPISEENLEEVSVYRQQLRDITKQEGFPKEIEWPIKPDILESR